MHVVVAGGTGFIGKALVESLVGDRRKVTVLTRRSEREARRLFPGGVSVERWRENESTAPLPADADAVVNLAGATIARRWTKAAKRLILASRVETTRSIVRAMRRSGANGPRILVNASAVGYYGPGGDEQVRERDEPGDDFLARVCRAWEAAAVDAEDAGVRVVRLRTGFVLGRGGALRLTALPFRLFVGGPLGSGRQWVPWIHLDDVVGLIRFALDNDAVSGPLNASAPTPVRNRDFAKVLGRVMGRPSVVPAPAFVLRLALGEMADMILTGQRAVPDAALAAGYRFRFTDVESALRDVLGV